MHTTTIEDEDIGTMVAITRIITGEEATTIHTTTAPLTTITTTEGTLGTEDGLTTTIGEGLLTDKAIGTTRGVATTITRVLMDGLTTGTGGNGCTLIQVGATRTRGGKSSSGRTGRTLRSSCGETSRV